MWRSLGKWLLQAVIEEVVKELQARQAKELAKTLAQPGGGS